MPGPSVNSFPSSSSWPGAWPPNGGVTRVIAKPAPRTRVVVTARSARAIVEPFESTTA